MANVLNDLYPLVILTHISQCAGSGPLGWNISPKWTFCNKRLKVLFRYAGPNRVFTGWMHHVKSCHEGSSWAGRGGYYQSPGTTAWRHPLYTWLEDAALSWFMACVLFLAGRGFWSSWQQEVGGQRPVCSLCNRSVSHKDDDRRGMILYMWQDPATEEINLELLSDTLVYCYHPSFSPYSGSFFC